MNYDLKHSLFMNHTWNNACWQRFVKGVTHEFFLALCDRLIQKATLSQLYNLLE